MENGAVNVRKYGEEKSGVIELDMFVESMKEEIKIENRVDKKICH